MSIRAMASSPDVGFGSFAGGDVVISAEDALDASDEEIANAIRTHIDLARYRYALSLCRWRNPDEFGEMKTVPASESEIDGAREGLDYLLEYAGWDELIDAAIERYRYWILWQNTYLRSRKRARSAFQRKRNRLYDLISERDGECCAACRVGPPLDVDHIKAIATGGTNDPANLQLLCRSCNASKGTETIDYR